MIKNVPDYYGIATEKTETTEYTENTENSFDRFSVNSVFSAISVLSAFSVAEAQELAGICLPRDAKDVNRALFQFARELRAKLPNCAVEEMVPLVEVWFKGAHEHIPDLEWGDVWCDFTYKVEAVKFPAGEDALALILRSVDEHEPPACATRYGGKMGRLVHILQRLQIEMGDKPFYMAGRKAGTLVGTTKDKAARWLKFFVREGILEITSKPTEFKATRYRYRGD